jgi:integrase/recombinase XerD
MLEDYSLHKVLTRRYYASKNPLKLNVYYEEIHKCYCGYLNDSELSASTVNHYKSISTVFMDYLTQIDICDVQEISMDTCNSYMKTQAGYSFKTVEQNVCGVRHFLRFLLSIGLLTDNFAEKIHMPSISKSAKIPSAWG